MANEFYARKGLFVNGGSVGYGGGEIGFPITTSGATSGIYTLATGSPIMYFDHRATSNTGFFVWRNGTGAASTLMTLNASGRLGIGTTSPKSLLHNNGSIFSGGTGDGTEINGSNVYMSVAAGAGISRGIKTSVTSDAGYAGMSIIGTNGTFSTSGLPSSGTYDRNLVYINGQTGNVGIGTTSPAELLHLQSSQPVIRYTKTGILNWKAGVITGNDYAITADNIATTALTIQSSTGNVGIGTTSPATKLDVLGNGRFTNGTANDAGLSSISILGSSSTSSAAALYLSQIWNGNSYNSIIEAQKGTTYGNAASDMVFKTSYFAGSIFTSEKMRITDAGNVGIGTTSPATLIHGAIPSVNNNIAEIFRLSDGAIADFKVLLNRGTSLGTSISVVNTAAGSMSFETSNTERMRITSAGNVGIGTTSPTALLQVLGATTLAANTRYLKTHIGGAQSWGANSFEELGLGYTGIRSIYSGSGENWDLAFSTGTSTSFNLGTQPERMRITSAGNVNIGGNYTSTTYILQVSGSGNDSFAAAFNAANSTANGVLIYMPGNRSSDTTYRGISIGDDTNVRFRVYGNGNVQNTNGSYGTISDIKIKENIIDATPKLSDILKLKVKNFNLIGDSNKQIGFIAQELEEIFPSLVDIDEKSKLKSVKTSILVPILVKSIQEQQQQIELLKNELETLKNK